MDFHLFVHCHVLSTSKSVQHRLSVQYIQTHLSFDAKKELKFVFSVL